MIRLVHHKLLVIIFTGLALYSALLFYFIPKDPIQSSSALFVENTDILPIQEHPDYGLPVSLEIPVISVNSAIEQTGLTPDGAMDVPKSPSDVAWFNLGPRPGEIGSAVIAGHYGIKDKKASAFDDLYKLRKGDKLSVEDDEGLVISFVVSGIRRFDPKADASSVFGSNDGKSHLNLISCEGIWDETQKGYPQRIVVFTDKE